jgi:hypothetical protein
LQTSSQVALSGSSALPVGAPYTWAHCVLVLQSHTSLHVPGLPLLVVLPLLVLPLPVVPVQTPVAGRHFLPFSARGSLAQQEPDGHQLQKPAVTPQRTPVRLGHPVLSAADGQSAAKEPFAQHGCSIGTHDGPVQ